MVDFGEGSCSSCCCCCDRGKTKSTPGPTWTGLLSLNWSLTIDAELDNIKCFWKAWLVQLFILIYIPVISNQIQDSQYNTWLTSVLNILEGLVCFGLVLWDYRHGLCPCLLALLVGI